jgi:hypothetical protein
VESVQEEAAAAEGYDGPYVTAENELDVDLDDESFSDFDGEPYIKATKIDTSVASDQ